MKDKSAYVQLITPDGERLMKDRDAIPWDVYPRPSLERKNWICLNGYWDFAIKKPNEATEYQRKIRVPFPVESVLSGIGERVPRNGVLCYRKEFSIPKTNGRVILHFGAVDQVAEVYVNGERQATHEGGYEHFSYDVTDCLRDVNVLEVLVTDALHEKVLPYGKQCEKRGGMWYTPVTGIWQTVWLECVPTNYIRKLTLQTDTAGASLSVEMSGELADGTVYLEEDGAVSTFPIANGHARIDVKNPVFWSPENPHLYRVAVEVGEDRVESYFALRTLDIREVNGVRRLCLNGKPYFFHGLLDQGYFSDGIFLPASPEGFEADILAAKRLGFNMLRKHIKLEPEQFYYDCDRLGMVVFQDMVNNGDYSFLRDTALPTVGVKRMDDRRLHRDRKTREAFLDGMKKTVRQLAHHPCVCYWTIFNEGWGQFDHASAYKLLKGLDSTRFIDSVSGWFLPPRGRELQSDVESSHVYFKPVRLQASDKPLVLSEFGGYSYKLMEHSFNLVKTYGYRSIASQREFEDALETLYTTEVLPAIQIGLCASVYTQLTDVEDETNGLLTYDRRREKVDAEKMRRIADALYEEIQK